MSRNLILAKDGRACVPIVISRKADRVVYFAALELRKYLQKISKAAFTIKKCDGIDISTSFSAIVVGAGDWEKKIDVSLEPACAPFDGFIIRFFQNKLFIRGVNSRSSLYGVYALLEKLGCEFIEPGIEHIPQAQFLVYSSHEIKDVAAFPLRTIFPNFNYIQKNTPFRELEPEVLLPQLDWMAKKRLNHYVFYVNFYRYDLWEKHKRGILDEILDRGFNLEVTHHSLHYFCPPDENHDFGDYGPSTYLKNHPDWYVPGLECGARGRWQTRVEKPEVRKVIIERFLQYAGNNPELKIIGLWPDDIPINRPYKNMSITDGYIKFWNQAGQALAQAYPDKRLAIIAYFDLTPPPRKIKPLDNLHCWYCPIERNYKYPIDNHRNKKYLAWLKGWIKKMPPYHVANFEYYGWQMELTPQRVNMKKDMELYEQLKLGGIYGWTGFENNIMGADCRWAIDMYALVNFLWNPGANLKNLEETWAKGVFGKAASAVLEFYDFLNRTHNLELKRGLASNYQWIEFKVMHKAQEMLASARKKSNNSRIMQRIDMLEKVLCRGCTEEIWREGQARVV